MEDNKRGMLSDKWGLQANTKALGTGQPDKDINQVSVPQSQADSINPSQPLYSTLSGPGSTPNKEALPLWSLPPGLHLLLLPPTADWAEQNLSMSTTTGATPKALRNINAKTKLMSWTFNPCIWLPAPANAPRGEALLPLSHSSVPAYMPPHSFSLLTSFASSYTIV